MSLSPTVASPIPARVEAALKLAFEAGWEMAFIEGRTVLPPPGWITKQREADWLEIRAEVYEKIQGELS
jgi:hypothetical protein